MCVNHAYPYPCPHTRMSVMGSVLFVPKCRILWLSSKTLFLRPGCAKFGILARYFVLVARTASKSDVDGASYDRFTETDLEGYNNNNNNNFTPGTLRYISYIKKTRCGSSPLAGMFINSLKPYPSYPALWRYDTTTHAYV